MLRSLLFVPGDSEKKMAKSVGLPADGLILDLEDAVAPSRKPEARQLTREYLGAHPDRSRTRLWVRINPLETPESLPDLAAVMANRPDGIIQPKTRSPDDVIRLSHYLDALETQNGIPLGQTKIIPVATETPQAIFTMGGFSRCGSRLAAITWGAEDLSTAVGAIGNKAPDGNWSQPFQLARSLCIFAASAAGVPALDTLFADTRDTEGLRGACATARRDGFSGKIAIHPGQVVPINEGFTPSRTEVERAQRIVSLFDANPGVGTLALDGEMLDIPHLRQARRTLEIAAAAAH
ncbi:MAG TPA: CoA ester lyase [Steroidobacteraceae bacterium]|nr:CoA ester lyase [Steroidobacteraceae bacterium]